VAWRRRFTSLFPSERSSERKQEHDSLTGAELNRHLLHDDMRAGKMEVCGFGFLPRYVILILNHHMYLYSTFLDIQSMEGRKIEESLVSCSYDRQSVFDWESRIPSLLGVIYMLCMNVFMSLRTGSTLVAYKKTINLSPITKITYGCISSVLGRDKTSLPCSCTHTHTHTLSLSLSPPPLSVA
jgi:hypothetical protein